MKNLFNYKFTAFYHFIGIKNTCQIISFLSLSKKLCLIIFPKIYQLIKDKVIKLDYVKHINILSKTYLQFATTSSNVLEDLLQSWSNANRNFFSVKLCASSVKLCVIKNFLNPYKSVFPNGISVISVPNYFNPFSTM